MPRYTLIDPVTGVMSTVTASKLAQHLQVNRILLCGNEPVGIITHRDLVVFSRWCAMQVLSKRKKVPPEARAALELVDKWVDDPDTVTSEELRQAAEAAVEAALDTHVAAYVAQAAAETVSRSAAWAVTRAVTRAARSAWVAGVSYEAQAQWLVEHLRSTQ